MLIDTHAHLSSSPLLDDIHSILKRAHDGGIDAIVNISTDLQDLEQGLALKQRYPWIYQATAVHPHDAEKEGATFFPHVAAHAHKGDLIAIGETGLDYHYTHSSKARQQEYLRKHLELALACSRPVIIHCREAYEDFFAILDDVYKKNGVHGPGVLHCFTGTLSEAEQVLNRNFFLSLSGIITFKKSEQLREVARMVPLDRLLIETDAPFLAPQSKRGKTNEPSYLVETAEFIASIKGISLNQLAEVTTLNAKRLFSF